MKDEECFDVYTISSQDKRYKGIKYVHWATNLTMVIKKGNVKIELNSEEIQKLVKSLPRTVGEKY